MIGEHASASGAVVVAAMTRNGFWIGSVRGRIWVELTGPLRPLRVRAGDRVRFGGTVVGNSQSFPSQVGLTSRSDADLLTRQGAHLAVTTTSISVTHELPVLKRVRAGVTSGHGAPGLGAHLGARRAQLARVSMFWRSAKETEYPVFPVARGFVTCTGGFGAALREGGFGVSATSLGSLERGGDGECRMDLGDGGPYGGAVLSVSPAEVFGCLRREFLGLAVVSWAIHRHSRCLVCRYRSDTRACLVSAPFRPGFGPPAVRCSMTRGRRTSC
jgi:hypothetical protein